MSERADGRRAASPNPTRRRAMNSSVKLSAIPHHAVARLQHSMPPTIVSLRLAASASQPNGRLAMTNMKTKLGPSKMPSWVSVSERLDLMSSITTLNR
jgi:hypothetical protein